MNNLRVFVIKTYSEMVLPTENILPVFTSFASYRNF